MDLRYRMFRRNVMQGVFALALALSTSAVFGDEIAQQQQQSCPSKPSSFFEDYEDLRTRVQLLQRAEEGYKIANTIKELTESVTRLANQQQDLQNALSELANSTKADVTRLASQLRDQHYTLSEVVNNTKVTFSVYRSSPYPVPLSTVTYDGVLVNLGGGMNATSGIFTAPVAGIYYFSAACFLITDSKGNKFALSVNGKVTATSGHNVVGTAVTISLSQTVQLAKGDKVYLGLWGNAYDGAGLFNTQFNGMLLHNLK